MLLDETNILFHGKKHKTPKIFNDGKGNVLQFCSISSFERISSSLEFFFPKYILNLMYISVYAPGHFFRYNLQLLCARLATDKPLTNFLKS